MVRYHRDVYDPYEIARLVPNFIDKIRISKHARYKIQASDISIHWPIRNVYPFEYYVQDNDIVKVAFRTAYNDKHDLCLVIDYVRGVVTTVWLVDKDYHHENLDVSQYERCPYG